jgi:diadenosine tetraphosphate (Ap4A) HIT family hydrolase
MKLEETVWALNSKPFVDTKDFVVYKDKYPVTEGHLLFVPKVEDWEQIINVLQLLDTCLYIQQSL